MRWPLGRWTPGQRGRALHERTGGRAVKCMWCGNELRFVLDKGYVHQDGELYRRKQVPCRYCSTAGGRSGSVAVACRMCQGTGRMWVDDHCALPKRS